MVPGRTLTEEAPEFVVNLAGRVGEPDERRIP